MQETTIQNTNDLLGFLWGQANSGQKNWFSFQQQKVLPLPKHSWATALSAPIASISPSNYKVLLHLKGKIW